MNAAAKANPKDKAYLQQLMDDGQALVVSLASRVRASIPFRVDIEDLIAYGDVGLAEAAREFDSEKGVAFTTFAYYRVRGAIYDGLSKMSWTSRARYRRMRFEQMSHEYLANQSDGAPDPTKTSLESDARWLRDTSEGLAVIFFASKDDPDSGIRDSAIADPSSEPAPAIIAQRELVGKLHELVNSLPKIEEQLIRKVYFEGATLLDAGRALGISKSWASRLHAKALEHLARCLRRLDADG